MHLHANAVLTVRQRQRLCDLVAAGVTISGAALVVGCSRQTASKWVNRGRRGESLADRSSRPRFSPRLTPAAVEEAILQAREQLREGPHVIGWAVGVAASTVHAVLRRHGRSRLVTRPQPEEVIRYEYAEPGGLIHVDIKKLGRIVKPARRKGRPAGSTCSSRSTTAPGLASRPSTPTKQATARSRSSTSSSASTEATGSA
jgi:transposase